MGRLAKVSMDFTQHYQPIVDLRTLQAVQYEALLRSRLPSGPAAHVAIAAFEDSGDIQLLDAWSLVNAIRASDEHGALVAVNVSAVSLCSPGFHARIDKILGAAGRPKISFEITETRPISSMSLASNFVAMVRDHGCLIGLDDFGDGAALFSTVETLGLDFLKLSSRLTKKIGVSEDIEDVIHHAVAICKARGMSVVGEHVETLSQMDWLRNIGVDQGQGWFFSKAKAEIDAGRCYRAEVDQVEGFSVCVA